MTSVPPVPATPLPGLGSLAQSARAKELRTARGIMIAIGVLSILANIVFMALARGQVDDALNAELKKQGLTAAQIDPQKMSEVRERALRVTYLLNGMGAMLGGVFIVLGILVNKRPVAATVTGLVLYIAANLAFGLLDPATLAMGAIVKIIIIVALVKSVSSALAYQKAQIAVPASDPAQGP